MVLLRYLGVGAIAGAIAIGLFYMMNLLIESDRVVVNDTGPNQVIEFVRIKKAMDNAMDDDEKLPEKQEIEEAPPPPEMALSDDLTGGDGAGGFTLDAPAIGDPEVDVKLEKGFDVLGAPQDTEVIPLVRVQPMYPPAAANQRIEGWVVMIFDISPTGRVRNPKVVSYHPTDIFNQSALQAIRKWKYRPRVEGGKKVGTPGVSVKLTFQLDNM